MDHRVAVATSLRAPMPLQDFLVGAALFAVMLAAVIVATALVVRRRLPHLDRLELALASVVVATSILIAVHLVPLMLAILTRGTVIAASLVAIGLAALLKPAAAPAAGRLEDEQPARPPSSRASWALAALAGAFTGVAALADLGRWAGDELVGVDPLTFHLPNVGRWIQHHSMWQIDQFTPLLAHGNYPNNGDIVLLSTVLPWHNDFLVRLPITFFLADDHDRRLRRRPRAARAACCRSAGGDRGHRAAGRRHRDDPARPARLAHVDDVRLRSAVPPAPRPQRPALGSRPRRARDGDRGRHEMVRRQLGGSRHRDLARRADPRRATTPGGRGAVAIVLGDGAIVGGLALLGALPWLVRNLLLSSNPVFPLKVAPLGITIFDAPPDVIRDQAGFPISDYFGNAHVLGQLAGEMIEGLGWTPVVCALAIAAAAAARPPPRTPAGRACPRARRRCASCSACSTPSRRPPRSG